MKKKTGKMTSTTTMVGKMIPGTKNHGPMTVGQQTTGVNHKSSKQVGNNLILHRLRNKTRELRETRKKIKPDTLRQFNYQEL